MHSSQTFKTLNPLKPLTTTAAIHHFATLQSLPVQEGSCAEDASICVHCFL